MAKTVLVADDNLTIQRMASEILSIEGVEIVTVSNGVAALKKLPEAKPLVIVADVDMPGKDGYEVCDFIKSTPELRHVRVLLAASDTDPYDPQRGAQARADGVIKKPFQREQLLSMVMECLSEAEALRAAAAQLPTELPAPPVITGKSEVAELDRAEAPKPAMFEAEATAPESGINDHGPGLPAEPEGEPPQSPGGVVSFEPATEVPDWESEPSEPAPPELQLSSAISLPGTENDAVKDHNSALSFDPLITLETRPQPLASDCAWLESLSGSAQPESTGVRPEHQEDSSTPAAEELLIESTESLLSPVSFAMPGDTEAGPLHSARASESPFEDLVDSVLADDGSAVTAAPLFETVKLGYEPSFPAENVAFDPVCVPDDPVKRAGLSEIANTRLSLDPGTVADIVRKVVARMAPPALPADALHELETRITADLLSDLWHTGS